LYVLEFDNSLVDLRNETRKFFDNVIPEYVYEVSDE